MNLHEFKIAEQANLIGSMIWKEVIEWEIESKINAELMSLSQRINNYIRSLKDH